MTNPPAKALDNSSKSVVYCTQREEKLLEQLRLIPFGHVEVHIMDGQPVRIERIKESIQL